MMKSNSNEELEERAPQTQQTRSPIVIQYIDKNKGFKKNGHLLEVNDDIRTNKQDDTAKVAFTPEESKQDNDPKEKFMRRKKRSKKSRSKSRSTSKLKSKKIKKKSLSKSRRPSKNKNRSSKSRIKKAKKTNKSRSKSKRKIRKSSRKHKTPTKSKVRQEKKTERENKSDKDPISENQINKKENNPNPKIDLLVEPFSKKPSTSPIDPKREEMEYKDSKDFKDLKYTRSRQKTVTYNTASSSPSSSACSSDSDSVGKHISTYHRQKTNKDKSKPNPLSQSRPLTRQASSMHNPPGQPTSILRRQPSRGALSRSPSQHLSSAPSPSSSSCGLRDTSDRDREGKYQKNQVASALGKALLTLSRKAAKDGKDGRDVDSSPGPVPALPIRQERMREGDGPVIVSMPDRGDGFVAGKADNKAGYNTYREGYEENQKRWGMYCGSSDSSFSRSEHDSQEVAKKPRAKKKGLELFSKMKKTEPPQVLQKYMPVWSKYSLIKDYLIKNMDGEYEPSLWDFETTLRYILAIINDKLFLLSADPVTIINSNLEANDPSLEKFIIGFFNQQALNSRKRKAKKRDKEKDKDVPEEGKKKKKTQIKGAANLDLNSKSVRVLCCYLLIEFILSVNRYLSHKYVELFDQMTTTYNCKRFQLYGYTSAYMQNYLLIKENLQELLKPEEKRPVSTRNSKGRKDASKIAQLIKKQDWLQNEGFGLLILGYKQSIPFKHRQQLLFNLFSSIHSLYARVDPGLFEQLEEVCRERVRRSSSSLDGSDPEPLTVLEVLGFGCQCLWEEFDRIDKEEAFKPSLEGTSSDRESEEEADTSVDSKTLGETWIERLKKYPKLKNKVYNKLYEPSSYVSFFEENPFKYSTKSLVEKETQTPIMKTILKLPKVPVTAPNSIKSLLLPFEKGLSEETARMMAFEKREVQRRLRNEIENEENKSRNNKMNR